MLVLSRKFTFAIIVNLPKSPEQQTMLGIMCLLAYVWLVYLYRPYTSNYLNVMDFWGTCIALALILSGLVMFGGYETMLGTEVVRRLSPTSFLPPASSTPPPLSLINSFFFSFPLSFVLPLSLFPPSPPSLLPTPPLLSSLLYNVIRDSGTVKTSACFADLHGADRAHPSHAGVSGWLCCVRSHPKDQASSPVEKTRAPHEAP